MSDRDEQTARKIVSDDCDDGRGFADLCIDDIRWSIVVALAAARREGVQAERLRCEAVARHAQDDVSPRSATASTLDEVIGGILDGDDPRYFDADAVEEARREGREEMRERCAVVMDNAQHVAYIGHGIDAAEVLEDSSRVLRALPLDPEDT